MWNNLLEHIRHTITLKPNYHRNNCQYTILPLEQKAVDTCIALSLQIADELNNVAAVYIFLGSHKPHLKIGDMLIAKSVKRG